MTKSRPVSDPSCHKERKAGEGKKKRLEKEILRRGFKGEFHIYAKRHQKSDERVGKISYSINA
jgi:hypothetical protein